MTQQNEVTFEEIKKLRVTSMNLEMVLGAKYFSKRNTEEIHFGFIIKFCSMGITTAPVINMTAAETNFPTDVTALYVDLNTVVSSPTSKNAATMHSLNFMNF